MWNSAATAAPHCGQDTVACKLQTGRHKDGAKRYPKSAEASMLQREAQKLLAIPPASEGVIQRRVSTSRVRQCGLHAYSKSTGEICLLSDMYLAGLGGGAIGGSNMYSRLARQQPGPWLCLKKRKLLDTESVPRLLASRANVGHCNVAVHHFNPCHDQVCSRCHPAPCGSAYLKGTRLSGGQL